MDIVTDGSTLVLSGDFDARCTFRVRSALYDLLAADEDVVVDLTDVTAVDVIALKVLGAASLEATRSGRHLTLRGCGPAVRRLLHLSHLIRVVEVERVATPA